MRATLFLLACLTAACSSPAAPTSPDPDSGPGDAGPDAAVDMPDIEPSCAPYSMLGPQAVGVRTLTIAGATVEAFYPAEAEDEFDRYDLRDWMPAEDQEKIPDDVAPLYEFPAYRDARATTGPYPVVLFSHGFGGYRLQSSVLNATMASWGYVVLAPEHPERNLTAVLESGVPMTDDSTATLLAVLDALEDEVPAGLPDLDLDLVAVSGHSAGGAAAMSVASDARFDLAIGWATASFEELAEFDTPTVIIAGSVDRVAAAARSKALYDTRVSPKLYASIENAGHLAFSDICLIGREEGGVLQIARDYDVSVPAILQTLAKDGCLPQDLPAEESWPMINELTIGGLQHHLRGEPPTDIEAVESCFGDLVAEIAAE